MLNPPKDGWSQVVMGIICHPGCSVWPQGALWLLLEGPEVAVLGLGKWREPMMLGRGRVGCLFSGIMIPYPLGNVCQGLLPKGECPHWQVFFPLKEFFPAVSPLSPMSGWQSWIAKYGYTNWEQHVIYIYILYKHTCFLVWLLMFFCVFANMIFADIFLPFAGEAGCEQAEHTRPSSRMFGRSTIYGNLNVSKPIMVIHKYGNL